jgi:predicted Rossmann fold flavoprotein
MYDCIIIGGGAAGIFAAIAAKPSHSSARVLLLEKSDRLLSKVRVSGGGRCNVTNACFDPSALIHNYPRGGKELIGPFHHFQPKDTIDWFKAHGVILKIEEGGRVFPITDSSDTIVKCLVAQAEKQGVEIAFHQKIHAISKQSHGFLVKREEGPLLSCKSLIIATGSSPHGYQWAKELGHTVEQPIPSLFSFSVPSSPYKLLSGISIDPVEVRIQNTSLQQKGPLLITHLGFSGPCILKLSAWGAKYLYEKNYQVSFSINWLPDLSVEDIYHQLTAIKKNSPQKTLLSENIFGFPKSLWKIMLELFEEICARRINDISLRNLRILAHKLHEDIFLLEGRSPNKDEFVTCGGISLKEIDFRTMGSKLCPGLFFAGEILDIDGLTGGFNLQNAWTTGFVAGTSCITV